MAEVTVSKLAQEVRTPVETLLNQLRDAGIDISNPDDLVGDQEKRQLLEYLSRNRGSKKTVALGGSSSAAPAAAETAEDEAAPAEGKKITLKRKSTSEIKLGGSRGTRGKTVSVEVRRKKPIIKRPDEAAKEAAKKAAEELAAAKAAEEEAAKEAAAKAAEAEQTAEEVVEPADEPAVVADDTTAPEVEVVAEEETTAAAEPSDDETATEAKAEEVVEEATATPVDETPVEPPVAVEPPPPIDAGRSEASASRRRAEENLRRVAEMRSKDKREQQEEQRQAKKSSQLHVAAGKGGKRKKKAGPARRNVKVETKHVFEKPVEPVIHEVKIPEAITVGELAQGMAVRAPEVIKILMGMGVMATINQTLDQDTAVLVVEEMGHTAITVSADDDEQALLVAASGKATESDEAEGETRPPVVTIMGHVDHGKTSLLDHIRTSRVAAGEAGGITQHIGAYHVEIPKGKITFLDTPGHAAFTRMRARGAQTTDVVILVVAADDGVMPQTKEAIEHANAAEVPLVVALTKIDREDADQEKVKNDLSQHGIIPEVWGGEHQVVGVSSHTGEGVDALLEAVLLQSELLELKAPANTAAAGVVVEASVEKGRGPVATVLVQKGTLKQGDVVLSGAHFGRVRALFNELGDSVKSAGPSIPVEVLGLSGCPDAGDEFIAVANERKARELASLREDKQRQAKLNHQQKARMDALFSSMGQEGERKALNIMLKCDVQGSAEALGEALMKIPAEEVDIKIVSNNVGGISESDVDLAAASNAIIIGFNVRADGVARRRIQETEIDVRYYSVIYDVLDDVRDAVSGLLGTELREEIVGIAEVRDVFRSSKLGAIAGCLVVEGHVDKGLPIRVLRDSVVIYEGELESLRRHKDAVQRVESGTECGIGVKNYNDVKAGDQIEVYERVEVQRKVTDDAA